MQKVFLLAGIAACTLLAASHDDDKLKEKSCVSFNFSAAKKLDVDLVSGNITGIAATKKSTASMNTPSAPMKSATT